MKWLPEGRWIATGFGLAMLVMGATSFISYQNATRLAESTYRVRETHEVLETLISILSIINEAESGRRGYILFNDPLELERYYRTVNLINSKLGQLQELVAKDDMQQQQLSILRRLVAQRLSLAQQSIRLHQQDETMRTAQISLRMESTRKRHEIQMLIATMQKHEEQSLELWVRQSKSSIQVRMLLELFGTLLTFLILLSVFVLLYRQMVKRQESETLQQKLAQEKELGELKLQFFSMVSHEFRTPLSSILGSAQLLDETLQPLVEKQKLKSLYRIQAAAQLMAQLLSDILTLARADAGKLEFNPKRVDMQSFCLNLLDDMQPLSQARNSIQFKMEGESNYAHVDERLLYSILSNLVSNAIKYSPNGNTIHFKLIYEPNSLTFQIRDRGIGIPVETQRKLYEPFHRGRNVGGIPGTGLGLVVAEKCLELHHGTMTIESKVDVGTTVTVIIPQKD